MPRSETSAVGKMIGFFQTAELETAELILGLCTDAVRARRQKSNAAKARALAPAAPVAPPAKAKKAKVKKARRTPRPHAATVDTPSLLPQMGDAADQEAGDLTQ